MTEQGLCSAPVGDVVRAGSTMQLTDQARQEWADSAALLVRGVPPSPQGSNAPIQYVELDLVGRYERVERCVLHRLPNLSDHRGEFAVGRAGSPAERSGNCRATVGYRNRRCLTQSIPVHVVFEIGADQEQVCKLLHRHLQRRGESGRSQAIGSVLPCSHRAVVERSTPSSAANDSWVWPTAFRRRASL